MKNYLPEKYSNTYRELLILLSSITDQSSMYFDYENKFNRTNSENVVVGLKE